MVLIKKKCENASHFILLPYMVKYSGTLRFASSSGFRECPVYLKA